MTQKKNTPIYIAALCLFLAGVGWLVYSGVSANSVYFLNVAEAKVAAPEDLRQVRLFGTVAVDDIEKHSSTPGVTFTLEDQDNASLTIRVRYVGAVPDAFKPGAEVIVEGGMGQNGNFTAKTLMTKCPSKYQKENRQS